MRKGYAVSCMCCAGCVLLGMLGTVWQSWMVALALLSGLAALIYSDRGDGNTPSFISWLYYVVVMCERVNPVACLVVYKW